jgi:outer membrane protein assembly factor BamB
VLITVVCPGCKTSYRVSEVLVGQLMRCPNSVCRMQFAVGSLPPETPPGAGPQAPVPPGGGGRSPGSGQQWSGSVNDFVPLLPSESAEVSEDDDGSGFVEDMVPLAEAEIEPSARGPVEASWDQPPPVRNAPGTFTQPKAVPEPAPKKPAARNGHRKAAERPTQIPNQTGRATQVGPAPTLEAKPVVPVRAAPAPVTNEDDADMRAVHAGVEEAASGPVELPPGAWEAGAPPVRRGDDVEEPAVAADSSAAIPEVAKSRRKRSALALMVMSLAFVVCISAAGYAIYHFAYAKSEQSRRAAANEDFKQSRFANAADDFADLAKRFSKSEHVDEDRSMEELSRLLASVTNATPADADDVLDKLGAFVGTHRPDPTVQEQVAVIGKATAKLVGDVIEAEKANPSDGTPARMDKVKFVIDKVYALKPNTLEPGVREHWETSIAEVRSIHDTWARRRDAREKVLAYLKDPTIAPVDAFKATAILMRQDERQFPGFSNDPEIKQAFEGLYERHFNSVKFVPADNAPADQPARPEINFPSIVFAPRIDGGTSVRPKNDGVVLSLVHGVLYAHSRATGEVAWVVRVGVDTTTLPIRVPETASSPERILVLLADSETLAAFDPSGTEVWRYRLGSPCLGRPVVVEPSVLLSTYDGQVHEVELAAGRLLGRWQLGQPLSSGGTREGKSKVVYFPAEDFCVYVLNVDPKNRQCQRILYSNHPAGSLRGEPLVIAPLDRSFDQQPVTLPGFLILNQTEGLLSTQMRVFSLPLADRVGPPITLIPEPRLSGWTWFTPLNDSEKVVAVTDDGTLGIFGIQQLGNNDPAMFPLLPTLINLDDLLKPEGKARDRAQVVNVQGDDFWVLSRGKLLRLTKTWNAAVGPKLVAGWPAPLDLGSPLHASQVESNRSTGNNTLVVVTQARKRQVCLASAIRDDDGALLWQREIGLVCLGAPVLLRQSGAAASATPAPAMVLAMGQSGEVYALDPALFGGQRSGFLGGAKSFVAGAGPLEDNPERQPVLIAGQDGLSAYEVAYPGSGHRMVVRRITFDPAKKELKSEERSIQLPQGGVIAKGPPALVGDFLVVALSNGVLFRVQVSPLSAEGKAGTNWRSSRIGSDAAGYVAALGPDTFVSTDGGKGLLYWKADDKIMWGVLSGKPDDESFGIDLEDRIVAPPLVLPRAANAPPQVMVACARGLLRIIRGTPDANLEETKVHWDLHGNITAGPFARTLPDNKGVRVGCVVDGRKLVWIDPKKGGAPLWEYSPPTGAAIVGEPQWMDGHLIVADQSGAIVALDPQTGETVGKGYTLPGSVAPSAPPVAFGADSLFTPLTDGTVVLIPKDLFH